MTNRHVFDHALAQRADGLVGHGVTPVSHEVANPMILRQDQPPRYAGLQCASCELSPGNLPRERFSSVALNVGAGAARFRQLSEAVRKTYARREFFSP